MAERRIASWAGRSDGGGAAQTLTPPPRTCVPGRTEACADKASSAPTWHSLCVRPAHSDARAGGARARWEQGPG